MKCTLQTNIPTPPQPLTTTTTVHDDINTILTGTRTSKRPKLGVTLPEAAVGRGEEYGWGIPALGSGRVVAIKSCDFRFASFSDRTKVRNLVTPASRKNPPGIGPYLLQKVSACGYTSTSRVYRVIDSNERT